MRRLSAEEKAALLHAAPTPDWASEESVRTPDRTNELTDFHTTPGYQQLALLRAGGTHLGVSSPFFRLREGISAAHSRVAGRELINFSSYNYLGLAGHPEVMTAAKSAIEDYGTSVSASRIVSGERPFHLALEQALAHFYGVDDALAFVSGHATNLSVLGQLLGPKDLILHDEYAHNSIVLGARLSGAQRLLFAHNDWQSLAELLRTHRRHAGRCLIVVEGIYSMDGDFPDLPRLLELKRRFASWLMVDEAHSLGVMGTDGAGLANHFSIDSREVDIWMGTLSKTLASCGGFIAGSQALVDQLRYLAPGFLYSVGLSPADGAAALKALEILQREPYRVGRLQKNGRHLLNGFQHLGIDSGTSQGFAIVPWIVGSSLRAVQLSEQLLQSGVDVQPILSPAVPERRARLRFFVSSEHSPDDIEETLLQIKRLA